MTSLSSSYLASLWSQPMVEVSLLSFMDLADALALMAAHQTGSPVAITPNPTRSSVYPTVAPH